MLKAGSTTGKDALIVLGLTKENIRRMQADEPVLVDLEPWGLSGKIVIFAGETEATMLADLQELIGPDTTLMIDPRLLGGHD